MVLKQENIIITLKEQQVKMQLKDLPEWLIIIILIVYPELYKNQKVHSGGGFKINILLMKMYIGIKRRMH